MEGCLCNHTLAVYRAKVRGQRIPIDFNERVGANLQRFRQESGMSQSDLAHELASRGLPAQQQTILKIEKGARPLRFEEAAAIGEILGISTEVLLADQSPETNALEAASGQLRNALAVLARCRLRKEELEVELLELDEEIEHCNVLISQAEGRLVAAGAQKGSDGRWTWKVTATLPTSWNVRSDADG
jgi:transcriptional regulator with XRE-family HTH domain